MLISPTRAKQLIENIDYYNSNFTKDIRMPYPAMTQAEHDEIIGVWRNMDGKYSFVDALWKIEGGAYVEDSL